MFQSFAQPNLFICNFLFSRTSGSNFGILICEKVSEWLRPMHIFFYMYRQIFGFSIFSLGHTTKPVCAPILKHFWKYLERFINEWICNSNAFTTIYYYYRSLPFPFYWKMFISCYFKLVTKKNDEPSRLSLLSYIVDWELYLYMTFDRSG